jgi:hypothetical protein
MTSYINSKLYDGCLVERAGFKFRVNIESDNDQAAPWIECDGHGVVSDWTARDKQPGERELHADGSRKLYYNVVESMKLALKDWGLSAQECQALADKIGCAPTAGQIAECAVELDFEYLLGWCTQQWEYVGVTVTMLNDDGTDGAWNSLWAVETSDAEYVETVVNALADNIVELTNDAREAHMAELAEIAYWAARDVVTEGAQA